MATINIKPKVNADESQRYEANRIARTIFQQMRLPNNWVFLSWGADGFAYGINEDNEPYLRFKVNGAKFKGKVCVVYDWNDTYKIAFVDRKGNVTKELFDIYYDQLQEVIDDYVERVPTYSF